MAKTVTIEQEPFLAPGQFWCEKNNQRLDIYQCVNRQSNVEKSNLNSRLYLSLKPCVNCLQGRKNRVRLENKGIEEKKYICEKYGDQCEKLKKGMCNACHGKDYRQQQKTKIETLEKKVSEMQKKQQEQNPEEQKSDDTKFQIIIDLSKHPALYGQIQEQAMKDLIMRLLCEKYEPGKK